MGDFTRRKQSRTLVLEGRPPPNRACSTPQSIIHRCIRKLRPPIEHTSSQGSGRLRKRTVLRKEFSPEPRSETRLQPRGPDSDVSYEAHPRFDLDNITRADLSKLSCKLDPRPPCVDYLSCTQTPRCWASTLKACGVE
ncbi:hypothetical protein R1flu_027490 [Riccia fluitans]|uniref:Uncharacterized protein n=1 Tax=Riccia fluitans TaxID=41844 RepID=A0ABD1XIY4_9MARC